MGVPQGSILSVTLFSLKIYSLATVLKNDTLGRLYVDDFVLCYKSKNMNSIERHLQLCLQKKQKQKQRASIVAPNSNPMMILVYI